jgi:hypothetical protein
LVARDPRSVVTDKSHYSGDMPATAVTELGAAGGRGLAIDHLINID